MKNYHTVAFDLDGTLADPTRGLLESFAYGLSKADIDYGDKRALKRFIGPPLYDEWKRVYALTEEQTDLALAFFKEYYQIYGWWDNRLYAGIPALLCDLRASGKRVCLATSKPAFFAAKVLDRLGIAAYFDAVGAAESDKTRDKKSDVLADVLAALGIRTPKERAGVILVGDRKYDAEGARALGIDSIGVRYGIGEREEIERSGFTYLAETVEDVRKILL